MEVPPFKWGGGRKTAFEKAFETINNERKLQKDTVSFGSLEKDEGNSSECLKWCIIGALGIIALGISAAIVGYKKGYFKKEGLPKAAQTVPENGEINNTTEKCANWYSSDQKKKFDYQYDANLPEYKIKEKEEIINLTKNLNFKNCKIKAKIAGETINLPEITEEYNNQVTRTICLLQQKSDYQIEKFFPLEKVMEGNPKDENFYNQIDQDFSDLCKANGLSADGIEVDFSKGSPFKRFLACVQAMNDLVYPGARLDEAKNKITQEDNLYWSCLDYYNYMPMLNIGISRNEAMLVQHLLAPFSKQKKLGVYHVLTSDKKQEYNILVDINNKVYYEFDTHYGKFQNCNKNEKIEELIKMGNYSNTDEDLS